MVVPEIPKEGQLQYFPFFLYNQPNFSTSGPPGSIYDKDEQPSTHMIPLDPRKNMLEAILEEMDLNKSIWMNRQTNTMKKLFHH